MKKILTPLFLALLMMAVLAVTIHATGKVPTRSASCGVPNTVKKSEGVCECQKSFLWNDVRGQCVRASVWCSQNFAKRSVYDSALNECVCRKGFGLDAKGDACVAGTPQPEAKVESDSSSAHPPVLEATLDDSDVANGSASFDFESGIRTSKGYPDLYMGGVITNGKMRPTLAGNLVEMEQAFDAVTECPESGYSGAGVDNAATGKVFCLKTVEGNYAKFEVEDAHYDTAKNRRVFKFRYRFNGNGNREMR
jgi:hypothetical protein